MKKILLHCVFPLLIGSVIYISFRSESAYFWKWADNMHIYDYLISFRLFINPNNFIYSNPFTQNLPDGLWVYSFSATLILVNKNKYYVFFPLFISFFLEFLQFKNILPGTFDVIDLLFYLGTSMIVFFLVPFK